MSDIFDYSDLAEHTELQVPFDVALAPAHLEAEDCPNQDVALTAAVFSRDTEHEGSSQLFDNKPRNRRSLGYFKRLYETRNGLQALSVLSQRTELEYLNTPYVVRNDNEELAWMLD